MYDRRKGRRQGLVSLSCLLAIAYFAYHATSGRRGYEARSELIQRVGVLEKRIASLEAARARLAHDVRLLEAGDPDLVEELAIDRLGLVRPGDRVVILPSQR
ncbi:MAG TPA: septum formation initiator family protein [Hyphomicrobiaceae bacterium]|nr:septum formation initiator family protein [Hyphomicrobiaceae bacterium]